MNTASSKVVEDDTSCPIRFAVQVDLKGTDSVGHITQHNASSEPVTYRVGQHSATGTVQVDKVTAYEVSC